MDGEEIYRLAGEWIGKGHMTMGGSTGEVSEYVRMERTDAPDILSYVRKSTIVFPGRSAVHNELGFIRPDSVSLMLHRGTYNILQWDATQQHYAMVAGSADTRQMTRKITVTGAASMHWHNFMEVKQGSTWVSHTVETDFSSLLVHA